MTIDLDELERLEREATQGPWTCHASELWEEDCPTGNFQGVGPVCGDKGDSYSNEAQAERDANLISQCRNALPALIRIARAAKEHHDKGMLIVGAETDVEALIAECRAAFDVLGEALREVK